MWRFILALALLVLASVAFAARPSGPPAGHVVKQVPGSAVTIRAGGGRYYYAAGVYYRRRGPDYVVVAPPRGARVRTLPPNTVSFFIGPMRYFYIGGTFYLRDKDEYKVVEAPAEASEVVASVERKLIINPAEGQSDDALRQDRYECHTWAADESGFDPAADSPDVTLKPDYNRAMTACLEARGYVVK